jgi:hypothetical protein
LPDLWVSLAGDCEHARSTALHNRCAYTIRRWWDCFCPLNRNSHDAI